jgi:hypothetical protein
MLANVPTALIGGINSGFQQSGLACVEFNRLCVKYGSDKGLNDYDSDPERPFAWQPHNYGAVYASIILDMHKSSKVRAVFECGIGTNNINIPSNMGVKGVPGASLRIWRDCFPGAHILGADLDREVLLQEECISSYFVDQLQPSTIDDMWLSISSKLALDNINGIDLMIDDGLHTFEANTNLLTHSWKYLLDGGYYVIEDITSQNVPRLQDFLSKYQLSCRWAAISLERPYYKGSDYGDNTLIVLQKEDPHCALPAL